MCERERWPKFSIQEQELSLKSLHFNRASIQLIQFHAPDLKKPRAGGREKKKTKFLWCNGRLLKAAARLAR